MPYPPPATDAPLGDLDVDQYSYSSFIYPLDLGTNTSGYNHFVVFHINENSTTQYGTSTVGGNAPKDAPTINQNVKNDLKLNAASTSSQNVSRVATTIVLPMPPRLESGFSADWGEADLGVAEAIFGREGSNAQFFKSLGASGLQKLGKLAQTFSDLSLNDTVSYVARLAVNNHREVLFNGVPFRTFDFLFRFVPQSEAEAMNVHNIIEAFRFYQAPEIVSGSAGRYMLYPAEFDIEFHANGIENPWLNKISTCALIDSDVNYTPTGEWSAHRPMPDGSAPGVCTEFTMRFKELEIMTKQRISQGY